MNADPKTVAGFGEEWSYFPQTVIDRDEHQRTFDAYFSIFPWQLVAPDACGADVGCGSGRWAAMVASRVGKLHLVDASGAALEVARGALTATTNLEFHHASVDAMPLKNASLDFAYSLGVLHHVPDTAGAIRSIASKLKTGAPFLIYLYYTFDNRPAWYRILWSLTNAMRRIISKTPFVVRIAISSVLAALVYLPLATAAALLERAGLMPANWPLNYYREKSFYTMRTDALDRFGTRLEHRYNRFEIRVMLESAGFVDIAFSEEPPYWCAVGFKGNPSTEA